MSDDIKESIDGRAQYAEKPQQLVVDEDEDIPTAAEEAALMRKLDRNILPLVFVLYSLSVLDRSNLGNAKLAGMTKDIDLSGNRYNTLTTIFYVAYIVSQWTVTGWKIFRPHRWAAFTVFLWGFIATIQATAFNWSGLAACRFFLGIAEAMFGPGVPLYLTYFYSREKVGFRHGVFISGAAAANAYGSALAYGISQIKGSVAPWKILFIIEGVPTCLLSVLAWWFIPDSLDDCKFLTDREKRMARRFVARNQVSDDDKGKTGLRFKQLLEAFKDPKSYLPAIMYFSCNVSFASLPLFIPTIISQMGSFTTIQSNGLSAPPYVLCFFMILLLTFLSDRFKVRGPFCATGGLLGGIGFIILATTSATAPRYVGVFLAVNIFASVAILLAWVANINATESRKAGGYTILATIGQCGPLLGTNVFPASEEPYYRKGMWISAAFCLLVTVVSALLSLWLIYENKCMAKAEAEEERTGEKSTRFQRTEEGRFRYVW
ncbi:MFS general substrate transporter [Rhizodiscina lignyota]|uniref:MFS general substrate transporter n=1 Tax=Rhizodiscina lignyota TaxID=1504668 RepID=A0A9P4M5S6_9PEZI|nr:MFS general substrate transporter [Rhizodiscina lignyota]